MNLESSFFYRHSGRFGVHGLALALFVPALVAFPLGFAYSYLIKWIPFIYLNVLITIGCGFVFGLLTGWLLKFGKVRSNPLALVCGIAAGLFATYFNWNGHVHALLDGAPLLCRPDQLFTVMKLLYTEGSWGLFGGGSLTGIALAVVWLVEAGIVIGLSTIVSYGMISDVPFCEQNQCWLDEKKTIDTFAAFTNPSHIASFQSGNIEVLSQADPRLPAAGEFGRLTLKYSPRCEEFYTVTVSNVTVGVDKEGNPKEETEEIARDIILPKSMFEFVSRFEALRPPAPRLANY